MVEIKDLARLIVTEAVAEEANAEINKAKQYCPVRTGRLRASIKVQDAKYSKLGVYDTFTIVWGSNLHYGYRANAAIENAVGLPPSAPIFDTRNKKPVRTKPRNTGI